MAKTAPKVIGSWKDRKFMSIPVDQLFIDESFQRGIITHKVNDIVANFDVNAMRSIVVSARGKNGSTKYSVLDGQNRIEACKQLFGENVEIPAEVHHGLTYRQEASLFTRLNESTPVSANCKFRANLAAALPIEVDINKIVTTFGFQLTFDKTTHKFGIKKLGALRRHYVAYGPEVFTKAMRILKRAFFSGGYQAEAMKPDFICGLIQFVDYCELSEAEIIQKLKANSAQAINYAVVQRLIGKARWGTYEAYTNAFAVACDYKRPGRANRKTHVYAKETRTQGK